MSKNILITGGAGFIGSHVVRRFVIKYSEYYKIQFDNLTYAGNLENLKDIERCSNYKFLKEILQIQNYLSEIFQRYKFDHVIHLAAESHVDRSISDPLTFVKTNVLGTLNLLEAFKKFRQGDFS